MESYNLHKLLKRQLKKSYITEGIPLNAKSLVDFLETISKTYTEYDEYNYILERSLELSLEEMELLQKEQQNSFESRLKAIIGAMPDIMFLNDEEGRFLEVFVRHEDELYLPKEEILSKRYEDIFPPDIAYFFKKNLLKTLQSRDLNIIEYELQIMNQTHYFEGRLIATGLEVHGKQTVITIVRDITKRKKAQEKLKYIATHDSLTKLLNRFAFQKKLKYAITQAKREESVGALFFLDIDRFKEINDNLGHDIGDKILKKITKRLQGIIGRDDILARFGGDEFVLIVNNIKSDEVLTAIAKKIMAQFIEPFYVKKYTLEITISMGICTFPKDIITPTQLLKQSDMAMYQAKALGKNNFQFFTKSLAEEEYKKFMLEVKLKHAILNKEFYLLYQPQIRILDNRLMGLEALIRWQSAEFGLVSPEKFISIAEKCGFIESITDWVIENVCQQIKVWEAEGFRFNRVAINLSRKELGRKKMAKRLFSIIQKHGISFDKIEFEVTESALFENSFNAFQNITMLRSMGFLISIDDFGTGYSSLSNLKDFLFDKLKIDRSFIMDLSLKKECEPIIKAIIAIAKSLNLKVIAEGVETKEQLDFLRLHGCDEMQGFLYSSPLPPKEVMELFTQCQ